MQVTILGSGTLVPDDTRRSAAHLIEDEGVRLLLDCGSGTVHGMARHGVAWQALTHVAISHFHTDHTGDLPALLWALKHGVAGGRTERLTLLGPPGLDAILRGMEAAHGDYVLDPGFPLHVIELEREGRWIDDEAGLEIRTFPTPHTTESVAFRVTAGGADVGYTGDTGPSASLGDFFRGVELLISECALDDSTPTDNHLSPASVAAILERARPGTTVLTHVYPVPLVDSLPETVRGHGYRGKVVPGYDGLRIELPGAGDSGAPEA